MASLKFPEKRSSLYTRQNFLFLIMTQTNNLEWKAKTFFAFHSKLYVLVIIKNKQFCRV